MAGRRDESVVWASWLETGFGSILAATSEVGVCFVHLVQATAWMDLDQFCLRHRLGPAKEVELARNRVQLSQLPEYLAGRRTVFDLPLDLTGTPFQRRCWQALLQIPFGETCTYAQLACAFGMAPGAARAVGQANGANPVPVIVPCHRVVASVGLGGYAGGLDLKRRLLELEGVSPHTL